jgi:hypothetical protein
MSIRVLLVSERARQTNLNAPSFPPEILRLAHDGLGVSQRRSLAGRPLNDRPSCRPVFELLDARNVAPFTLPIGQAKQGRTSHSGHGGQRRDVQTGRRSNSRSERDGQCSP